MSTQTLSPSLSQTIASPIAIVYEAFTNDTRLCEWLCYDAQLAAQPKGRLYMYWQNPSFYAMGEFIDVVENERLLFRWQDTESPVPRDIEIGFHDEAGKTRVDIYHEGEMSAQLKTLWQRGLKALEATQTQGYHPNLTERPMLGVLIGGLINTDNAQQFAVPITHGVHLMGTVPGLSAERAGLQQGDVIASLAGVEINSFQDMGDVIQQYKAGDTIDLLYYRGASRHELPMELMSRPLHPYPETGRAFAQWYQEQNDGLTEALAACFEGVSDTTAASKPASEDWSASEVMAHLVLAERDFQAFVSSLVQGNELEVFSSNLTARVSALVTRYASISSLLQAFNDTCAETVSLLTALDDDFLLRKASVVRIQLMVESNPYHVRHHIGQIQRALEASQS